MKTARLIITLDCVRSCPYCCNEYQSMKDIMKLVTLTEVSDSDYDEIVITGGEPMLYPEFTRMVIKRLKADRPERPVFLYTTHFEKYEDIIDIISLVDGLTFSIHEPFLAGDKSKFMFIQSLISNMKQSFRLFINKEVVTTISLIPSVWDSIKVLSPIPESKLKLPEHEDLLILRRETLDMLF